MKHKFDPLSEVSIRTELLRVLWNSKADEELFIWQEVGLLYGSYRADVIACSDELAGFEIKSSRDNLSRFQHQMRAYSSVFDRASAVVTLNHLREALEILPEWWGLTLATSRNGHTALISIRESQQNPSPDSMALASLLWKTEATQILANTLNSEFQTYLTRRAAEKALVDILDWEELRTVVINAMRRRKGWLPAYSPLKCDG